MIRRFALMIVGTTTFLVVVADVVPIALPSATVPAVRGWRGIGVVLATHASLWLRERTR